MRQNIVFLSGLAGTSAVWQPLAELSADHIVSIPKVPWSIGNSDWPHNSSVIPDFFAHTLTDTDVVIAHSFAATLLLEYLATSGSHGGAVPKAAVLISTFYRSRTQNFRWKDINHFLIHFDRILTSGIHASSSRTLDTERAGDMARVVREQIGPYGWMAFYATYLRTPFLDPDAITCPISLIHGAKDSAAPVQDSRDLAHSCTTARLHVLADVGHFPMKEAPTAVFEAIYSPMPELKSTPVHPSKGGASQ